MSDRLRRVAAHKSRPFELPSGYTDIAGVHGNHWGCHVPTDSGQGPWYADFRNHSLVRHWLAILEGLRWGGLKGGTFILRPFVEGSVDIFGTSVDFQRIIVVVEGLLWWGHCGFSSIRASLVLHSRGWLKTSVQPDSGNRLGPHGSGGHGPWVRTGRRGCIDLLPLGNIVVEAGYNVLVMAVAVCIVGGLGSWTGAVLAAFLIGFAQILTVAYFGAHYQIVVALCAIILALILRPSGLLVGKRSWRRGSR